MERQSWRWRSPSDKSPGESESSGSVSSHSERCSDDQDALRDSPISTSPGQVQSPEVSSNIASSETHKTINSLNEKLSAALSNIKAKEDLVKQHAKVAEEAVLGWEKAETEVAALKQQLEAGAQKNSALNDRISQLDGALKECVRQLRQSREDQERKIHEALIEKTHEWELEKSELENRLIALQAQLDAKNVLPITSVDHDFRSNFDALKIENFRLKAELLARSEDLQNQMLEKELSTSAAETASKQHLESIKKVAKLEAECRRLRAALRKSPPVSDHKPLACSVYVESLTDSQSDSGERLSGIDNEQSCSDSWASTLILELDHFKSEKGVVRDITATSVETDLMDDFLEMERLAASTETDHGRSSFDLDARDHLSKTRLEAHRQIAELKEKIEKMTSEKSGMDEDMAETRNKLKLSRIQLVETEDKLVELQSQLNSVNSSKHIFEIEAEEKIKDMELQLESAKSEIENLQEKMGLLDGKLEEKSVLCAEFELKCHSFGAVEEKKKRLESELSSVNLEVMELRKKVDLLERNVEEERTLGTELTAKCRNMEDALAKSKDSEAQLRFEIVELHVKVNLLEGKAKEERAVSAEFAAELDASVAERKELSSLLELASLESKKLHEKIDLLERDVEEARALSADYEILSQNLKAMEAERKKFESELRLARTEVEKLREIVDLLEASLDEARGCTAEVASKLAATEARKRAVESELESTRLEVERLHEEAALLRKEAAERECSAEYTLRCESLENKLSRKKGSELQSAFNSSSIESKTKKERALNVSGGNLEDCRRTIASLGRQLKSLATFEDFMLEAEEMEGCKQVAIGNYLKSQTIRALEAEEMEDVNKLRSGII